jgi:large subunit ribosomal protein L10
MREASRRQALNQSPTEVEQPGLWGRALRFLASRIDVGAMRLFCGDLWGKEKPVTLRAKKTVQTTDITEALRQAQAVILTDYRGFNVTELAQLRGQLRGQDVRYMVAKNTLTRRALQAAGMEDPGAVLEGPTALAFLMGDLQGPAKTLLDLSRARKPLPIKAMFLGKRVAPPAGVEQLATLPSREQLYARVVGGIAGPVVGLLSVLQGSVAGLAYVLQARVEQLGGAPPPEPAAAEAA